MIMKDDYVSFETAQLAKEKGFNIPVNSHYTVKKSVWKTLREKDTNEDNYAYSRPTQSLLAKWLRSKYDMCIIVYPTASGYCWELDKCNGTYIKDYEDKGTNSGGSWDIYEEALENGIQEALKLIK